MRDWRCIREYWLRALNPRSGLRWPIRLRLALILPWSCRWNARVRDWTARLEGHASYDAETTDA